MSCFDSDFWKGIGGSRCQPFSFLNLPAELQSQILEYLGPVDLLSVRQASKATRAAVARIGLLSPKVRYFYVNPKNTNHRYEFYYGARRDPATQKVYFTFKNEAEIFNGDQLVFSCNISDDQIKKEINLLSKRGHFKNVAFFENPRGESSSYHFRLSNQVDTVEIHTHLAELNAMLACVQNVRARHFKLSQSGSIRPSQRLDQREVNDFAALPIVRRASRLSISGDLFRQGVDFLVFENKNIQFDVPAELFVAIIESLLIRVPPPLFEFADIASNWTDSLVQIRKILNLKPRIEESHLLPATESDIERLLGKHDKEECERMGEQVYLLKSNGSHFVWMVQIVGHMAKIRVRRVTLT